MLIHPVYPKLWRNKAPGVAQSRSHAGYFLRTVVKAVDPQTPRSINWRHVFGNTRRNWTSLAVGNQGYEEQNSIPVQTAWEVMNSLYNGILLPGYIEGQAGFAPQMSNCISGAQFYQMAQTLQAALGLTPLTYPPLGNADITSTTYTATATSGIYTGNYTHSTEEYPDPLNIYGAFTVKTTGQDSSTWTITMTGLPPGVTAVIPTPTFTLAYNSTSGESLGGSQIQFTAEPYAAPSSSTATLTATSSAGSLSVQIALAVATGATTPVTPPAMFALPASGTPQSGGVIGGLSAHTIYDDALNVTGFRLLYKLANTSQPVMRRYSNVLQNLWQITASAPYTDSYAPPAPSQWSPITYNGFVETNSTAFDQSPQPDAENPYDALVRMYGGLPAKGEVKFMVQPIDPPTGASGPALTATALFETGTFRGANIAQWMGNGFQMGIATVVGGPPTLSGSNPWTLTIPGASMSGTTGPNLYYAPTLADMPPYGPAATTVTGPTTLTFSTPAGAPAPTNSDVFLWLIESIAFPVNASTQFAVWIVPSVNTSSPPGDPWGPAFVNAWPTGYTFPKSFSLQAKCETYYPNGSAKQTKIYPPGLSISFSPTTQAIASATSNAIWFIGTGVSTSYAPEWDFTFAIEATDGVYTQYATISAATTGSGIAPPPQSFVTMDKITYNLPITGAGTYKFPVTLSNTDSTDYTCAMMSATQSAVGPTQNQLLSTPYSITWDNQLPDVPAASGGTPGTITVNCTIVVPPNIATGDVQIQIAAISGSVQYYATVT